MAMSDSARAQLQIHFCVLLWGFTAILGKLISLPALPLVWWRMLIVVAILAVLPRVWRGLRAMGWRRVGIYSGIGVLVALHWLTFYGAIKLANASVAATCVAVAAVFTALIEPLLTRQRFSWRDVALGIGVIPGVMLVVGGVPDAMHFGVVIGILSALFVAVFGSLNKRMVEAADPLTITAVELGAGTIALTVLAPLIPHVIPAFDGDLLALPTRSDTLYLLLLAIACTLLPFVLSLVALRHMSAFDAQLAVNLEPVYTILLAIVLLNEHRELTPMFYAGVAIIVITVLTPALLAPRSAGTRRSTT